MNFTSRVPEVDQLWIERLPARPIKVAKVVRDGNTTIALGANGTLYWSGAKRVCYTPGNFERFRHLFAALVKLGVLTKEQVEAHKGVCDAADERRAQRYLADDLLRVRKTGMKLTKAQEAHIAKWRPEAVTS